MHRKTTTQWSRSRCRTASLCVRQGSTAVRCWLRMGLGCYLRRSLIHGYGTLCASSSSAVILHFCLHGQHSATPTITLISFQQLALLFRNLCYYCRCLAPIQSHLTLSIYSGAPDSLTLMIMQVSSQRVNPVLISICTNLRSLSATVSSS